MVPGISLKLVSLNIEKQKHFERVLPFLRREKPDIVCLQELCEPDTGMFERELGMKGLFAPMAQCAVPEEHPEPILWGLGLFSRYPLRNAAQPHYYGTPSVTAPRRSKYDILHINRLLLHATVVKEGTSFTVGTTHFTWSVDGVPDDNQRRDLAALLKILESIPDIAFCGDFNAPRGWEIFDAIAKTYRDCVPPEYETSIDPVFHRAGALALMIDGFFVTSHYRAENTRVVCGLSDHCAVVSELRRSA